MGSAHAGGCRTDWARVGNPREVMRKLGGARVLQGDRFEIARWRSGRLVITCNLNMIKHDY